MRCPAPTFLPAVLMGLSIAACSAPEIPADQFHLQIKNPTPSIQARTHPFHEPGDDPYNRTIPLP